MKWLFKFGLRFIRNNPKLKFMLQRALSRFPRLYSVYRLFYNLNRSPVHDSIRRAQRDPLVLDDRWVENARLPSARFDEVCRPLPKGQRIVYYYADHTVLHPANDDLQQFVRQLSIAFMATGEVVRFVKWDSDSSTLILINQRELAHLSDRGGPVIAEQELSGYPVESQTVPIGKSERLESNWLVVPEVIHGSHHSRPVTLDIQLAARSLGLRTAFVFHDALPLKRPELKSISNVQQQYMQYLMLADLVVPTSLSASSDLISYWQIHQGAKDGNVPSVTELAKEKASVSWSDYADLFSDLLDEQSQVINRLGTIYYWVDHTAMYPATSGIQRVVRGLAKALMEIGVKLVPVSWDIRKQIFKTPNQQELNHLSKWNGPDREAWSPWTDPLKGDSSDWILIPELASYGPHDELAGLRDYVVSTNLRCAWIFFDAIPWKMRDFYSDEKGMDHGVYMAEFNRYERVFPISESSRMDLMNFLSRIPMPSPGMEERIRTCLLPGEFPGTDRIRSINANESDDVEILCVGTVEPRKNHIALIRAFLGVLESTKLHPKLVIAGGSTFPKLANEVNLLIDSVPEIVWETRVDDERLKALYERCDFTVYPSLDEGFGLPILESLWNGKPCICSDRGAIAETAQGGGCILVDVTQESQIAAAMQGLIENSSRRLQLIEEATTREFKSWQDYAYEIAAHLAVERPARVDKHVVDLPDQHQFYTDFCNLSPRPLLSVCMGIFEDLDELAMKLEEWTNTSAAQQDNVEFLIYGRDPLDASHELVGRYLTSSNIQYISTTDNHFHHLTAQQANGQYLWILPNHTRLNAGALDGVVKAIESTPDAAFLYLNSDRKVSANDTGEAAMEVDAGAQELSAKQGRLRDLLTNSPGLFATATSFIIRRDHAIHAYAGLPADSDHLSLENYARPIKYVLEHMLDDRGIWIEDEMLVFDESLDDKSHQPLWILERLPQMYDLAQKMGVDSECVDSWRREKVPNVLAQFARIYQDEFAADRQYFNPDRLVQRFKHLDEFAGQVSDLCGVYEDARNRNLTATGNSSAVVFSAFDNVGSR